MFEAKLKSRSQPKLGALAVTFPIPEERYENVILALQNLQIGDVPLMAVVVHLDSPRTVLI